MLTENTSGIPDDTIVDESEYEKKSWEKLTGLIIALFGSMAAFFSVLSAKSSYDTALNNDGSSFCSINPVFSCSDAAQTPIAEMLGFPNAFLGIGVFAAAAMFGLIVFSGVSLPRWLWWFHTAILSVIVVLSHIVFYVQTFDVSALCLFCVLTWLSMMPAWWYSVIVSVRGTRVGEIIRAWHLLPLIVWYMVFGAMIFYGFFWYWKTLF